MSTTTESRVQARAVAEFAEGAFIENVAVDAAGRVFVTNHPTGEIECFTPDGVRSLFAKLPVPATGLAFAADGALYASAGTPGQQTGSIWRVSADAAPEHILDVGGSIFFNGLTPTRDGMRLLVVDSFKAKLFVIDLVRRTSAVWLEDERLAPNPNDPNTPGANGVKFFGGHVYVSNTGNEIFYRIALGAKGEAGRIEVVAENQRADDFCFDVRGNAYLTTHPYGTVVKLAPDGKRTVIAGAEEGIAFSTACAFGRAPGDETALYVTNETLYAPKVDGRAAKPKLVRLEIGIAGYPLFD